MSQFAIALDDEVDLPFFFVSEVTETGIRSLGIFKKPVSFEQMKSDKVFNPKAFFSSHSTNIIEEDSVLLLNGFSNVLNIRMNSEHDEVVFEKFYPALNSLRAYGQFIAQSLI